MGNIVLIGMPASGKSTVGIHLAEKLNINFIDTDDLIEKCEGMKLQEIIDERGNDYFWNVEERILCNLKCNDTVIATGGSAILFPKAIDHLKEIGKIVYLEQSIDLLKMRLSNLDSRGVTLDEGESIESLYNYRVPLYRKYSQTTVKVADKSVEDVVDEIIKSCINK
ncbi:hypothetical protein HMPREF1635_04895 [Clostridiales bacterium S5-A14a]|nr:hypothetical protein HMPREF1635_04895 [Clostridiales bacterium S5-A14a]